MLQKFSIGYNIEKNNRKPLTKEQMQELGLRKKRTNLEKRLVLSEDIVSYMLNFGFSMDQIYLAFNLYKFITIEEAVHVMMKDPENNKYVHKYIDSETKKCRICSGKNEEHIIEIIEPKIHHVDESDSLTISEGNKPQGINSITESNSQLDNPNSIEHSKKNIIKINLPQNVLDDFEDPYICHICFNSRLNVDAKITFFCLHEFCRECVFNYLKTNITNGNVLQLRCLYGGCPRLFTNEEVRSIVDEELWAKYKKFLWQKLKLSQPNVALMNCPFPDCDDIVEIDPLERQIFVECEFEHKFCSKCKEIGWHQDGKCEKYDNNLLMQINKNSNVINFKQCPTCKVIIEKNDGCNHMKCINCDYEFCWLCMKQYLADHYAIYNFTGCPGMRYSVVDPEEKNWWDNKIIKCLWFFLSIILGIVCMCFILAFFFFFGCAYEFVKCYLQQKFEDEDVYEDDYEMDHEYNNRAHNEDRLENQKLSCCQIIMCIFLACLGLACQPLYLMFFVIYGMMECYRRFGCWMFYASSF